jgi:hypothetical protein
MNIRIWLQAFRLRTLPLALSCVAMGGFLAAERHLFQWNIFLLCVTTTIFLQVLSNLANDYGDSIHGADGVHREGPVRTTSAVASPRGLDARPGGLYYLSVPPSGLSEVGDPPRLSSTTDKPQSPLVAGERFVVFVLAERFTRGLEG